MYQITGIANLTGRSKSMDDATYTARLKTGAGQSKRLAVSWALRVFRPTDQGFRRAVLLAPPNEQALVHASLTKSRFLARYESPEKSVKTTATVSTAVPIPEAMRSAVGESRTQEASSILFRRR